MLQIRLSSTLDGGDFGWLKAKHHFIVSPDGNPANKSLGALVVWNDDQIAPGTGFSLHSHANMEIVTYVREGTVTHRDSMGNVGHTAAGDVQAMSAGTGIRHSEHNLGTELANTTPAASRSRACSLCASAVGAEPGNPSSVRFLRGLL